MFVNRPLTTRAVVFIGLLGALSFLLMSFEFPLPFAPAYMKFEISDMPALFGGFFLGPIAGALAAFVKILLKLVIIGTNSALVGEVMNLFCSIAYVVPSTIFYHLHHSKKRRPLCPCVWLPHCQHLCRCDKLLLCHSHVCEALRDPS